MSENEAVDIVRSFTKFDRHPLVAIEDEEQGCYHVFVSTMNERAVMAIVTVLGIEPVKFMVVTV